MQRWIVTKEDGGIKPEQQKKFGGSRKSINTIFYRSESCYMEASSSYSSGSPPPPLHVNVDAPANSVRQYQIPGRSAGSPGAPDRSMQIEYPVYEQNSGFCGDWRLFGPVLSMSPVLTLSKPAVVEFFTCYVPVSISATVKIMAKTDDEWRYFAETTVVDRYCTFSIREFASFCFLLQDVYYMKSVYYKLYTRQEGENEYEAICCFCDDYRETRLEAEKQMEMRGFTSSGTSGTFLMRHNDNVKVAVEIPDCDIEDRTQTIPAVPTSDLWNSNMIKCKEFKVKNMQNHTNIEDIAVVITVGENAIAIA